LEVWERVILTSKTFSTTLHYKYGCIACHGGTSGTDDKAAAHEGMVRDPDAQETCALCHAETVAAHDKSLHSSLQGYWTVLEARSSAEHLPQIQVAFNNHCASCHASCGQCHVSRPTANEGGLLAGHDFKPLPPMNLTCTGCHGSRINDEYKGENQGYPADVHYNPGGMACFVCHTGNEMHGVNMDANHRYDGAPTPGCTDADCHPAVKPGDGVAQHDQTHLDKLSCQVCHAVDYKNCYSCHVQKSADGTPFYKIDESQMSFKIGRNPRPGADRPWDYVPVRHVPIARDTFDYYGKDLLSNFDKLPTWVYATPHNIQLSTPQNASCNACHGNKPIFLTADSVNPDELKANRAVIVEEIPPPVP